MIDCHVHSHFSGDSNLEINKACEKAISIGLKGIIFTDHLDIDYPGYDSKFDIDFSQYIKTLSSIKDFYKGKLEVLIGVEVGIQPHIIKETQEIISSHPFDFVIGSVHIVNKQVIHEPLDTNITLLDGQYSKGKTQYESYLGYLLEVLNNINLYNNFDVLGHMDLIRRYGKYKNKELNINDFKDIIDMILKYLILQNKGLEVNTSGFKYGLNSPMPNFDILKRYQELGGNIITIGSDAHSDNHIGYKFDEISSALKDLGFNYLWMFSNRTAYPYKIK